MLCTKKSKIWSPCQQESRSDPLMTECKDLMATWTKPDKAAAWSVKPVNGAWHKGVSEFADTVSTYQWHKKSTSEQTLRLWSLQLKRRPSTSEQWHMIFTTLCKILDEGSASNMQKTWEISPAAAASLQGPSALRDIWVECNLEHSKDWWVKPEKLV